MPKYNLIYAYTLLYKSFDLENTFKTKQKECSIKLRKEPKLYEKKARSR